MIISPLIIVKPGYKQGFTITIIMYNQPVSRQFAGNTVQETRKIT
jgi:hypothetical protein